MRERIKNFFRYRYLLWELVKKGIKLKYRRSYLGILWSLLEPLLTMIVLTVIFGTLFGHDERTCAVNGLSGRLLYTFFSQATNSALRSIRGNSGMIKKVYVPKYLYPLSGILFNYVIFLLSLIVLAVVSLVMGYCRSVPPGYGVSLERSVDAGNVHLCHFLLSGQADGEWKRMAVENQPAV